MDSKKITIMKKRNNRRTISYAPVSPRRFSFLKDLHVDEKTKHVLKIAGECVGIIILTAIVGYTVLNNFAPLGVTTKYSLQNGDKNMSGLGPRQRIDTKTIDGQHVYYQKDDLVYFTTKMPFDFDTATVKVTYQNPDPEQTLSIGYQDQEKWHYDTKSFDIPFLNNLSWQRNGEDPVVLYQREPNYPSVDAFLKNPPKDALIGTYAYDTDIGDVSHTKLPGYQPETKTTVIDTLLRGRQVIYAYLEDEPFKMTLQKQDLNWYEDPDVMTVKIYKGNDIVFQATADDDGITDDSRKIQPAQEIVLQNPGPELPETGVYKIIIDANPDTVIRQIATNLHKVVFAGSLFPIANTDAYNELVASTAATTVYTNAFTLSATTYHEAGKQDIFVDNQLLDVNMLNTDHLMTPANTLSKVTVPKNDVVLNAFQGYFSFDPKSFFLPSPYYVLPLNKKEDVDLVDYILTDYLPPHKDGQWLTQERVFDLSKAYVNNERLSWLVKAPKLKSSKEKIKIKDIEVTFYKKPIL